MLSTIQVPFPSVSAPPSPSPPAAAVLVFCVTLNCKIRIVVPHQWGVDKTTASGVARFGFDLYSILSYIANLGVQLCTFYRKTSPSELDKHLDRVQRWQWFK